MENIDLTNDFMQIAKVIVENSEGKIRLAFGEKSNSLFEDKEAQHFLKLHEKRIREDIEYYGLISTKDNIGHALPELYFLIKDIRMDCPLSYAKAIYLIQEIGNQIFEEEILINWNRMFKINP